MAMLSKSISHATATLVACCLFGCYLGSASTGPTSVTVTLRDGTTNAALTDSLVAVEVGGWYLPIADRSKGNPAYTISAKTDAQGQFTITVPRGPIGVHTFQNSYKYGTMQIDPYGQPNAVIAVEPSTQPASKPTVTGFASSASTIAPQATLQFSATVTHGGTDPISDEVLLIEPTTNFVVALDPPSPGQPGNYPDGVWRASVAAPKAPGKYTYSLVVSSEGCIVSDRVSVDITVQ